MNFYSVISLLNFLTSIELFGLGKGIVPIFEYCLYSPCRFFFGKGISCTGFYLSEQKFNKCITYVRGITDYIIYVYMMNTTCFVIEFTCYRVYYSPQFVCVIFITLSIYHYSTVYMSVFLNCIICSYIIYIFHDLPPSNWASVFSYIN